MRTMRARVPSRSFFARDPRVVAPELLGLMLVGADGRAGRIVEVEAYADDDPAAHSFGGRTARNASMFGPPGHLYVYRSYGLHWCANVVCATPGVGAGVLLRALEPLSGLEAMRAARGLRVVDRDLCRGPGRLAQAMGITGADDGIDLLARGGRFTLRRAAGTPAHEVDATARIGISKTVDAPWRWLLRGSRFVSR
jgi:DNA-3-methyladenine glycosylase